MCMNTVNIHPKWTYIFSILFICNTIYPCSDIEKVHDAIGDRFSLLIQWTATFIIGFVVAFVRDWHLSLFLLIFIPLLVTVYGAANKVHVYAFIPWKHCLHVHNNQKASICKVILPYMWKASRCMLASVVIALILPWYTNH